MASVKGSGSELAFFGHGKSGANVNIDLTTNGQGTQPEPIRGKLNIEVFTQTPGPVAPGYDGAVYVPDATLLSNNVVSNVGQQNVTEELLSGSYKVRRRNRARSDTDHRISLRRRQLHGCWIGRRHDFCQHYRRHTAGDGRR